MSNPQPLNLTYQGITMNINRWSVYAGMHRGTLRTRINSWLPKGWDVFKGTRIEGKMLNINTVIRVIERISKEKAAAKRPDCHVCGKPVRNFTSGNQVYCSYTKAEQKIHGALTECQLKAKNKVVTTWKQRLLDGKGPKNVDSVSSYRAVDPLFQIVDVKDRACIGLLTTDHELGPHTFESSGPHHRVCNKCHAAAEGRAIYDKQAAKINFGK